MEPLIPGFNMGYTAALMDLEKLLPCAIADLKRARRLNEKQLSIALALFIDHREEIRNGSDGFVRWNFKKKELEWYASQEVRTTGDTRDEA